jgi:hypothetical protein
MSRRVYLSAPVAGFDAQAYERVLAIFRARGAEVVSSRALFGSSEQWAKGFVERSLAAARTSWSFSGLTGSSAQGPSARSQKRGPGD